MRQKKTIQQKAVDTLRILSVETITKAKSGHPGICMGAAPIIYTLYSEIMNYSSVNPKWENRDRFVLSAGHGSAMLYSTLHLFGFGLTKEDLTNFRQYQSKTPGHPELNVTEGVDVSTGALGQGVAMAVGMALAEAHLAGVFNRESFNVVDHYTYCICGEGCLEEGIGYEACSFAGTQKLSKLILFYDCNKISIEGNTDDAFTDDITLRFKSQGWQVLSVDDSNDLEQLRKAVKKAKKNTEKPSVIICHSKIGYGTPNENTAAAHGTPLTEEQLAKTKEFYNWTLPPFEVPDEVRQHCLDAAYSRARAEKKWESLFKKYRAAYPGLADKYDDYFNGKLPDLSDLYENLKAEKPEATRISGGIVINELAKRIPNLLSGSADLTPSTKTNLIGESWLTPENRTGRNIHFGIREHAMAAICNGVAVHGGLRILCSTFFVFADYMKGAMRLSAIMKLPVTYVLTHDSIGVGEDGPTHQPIEQLAALRATPNIKVFRPCDGKETVAAYVSAFTGNEPTAIVLSRQNLPQYKTSGENVLKGGYIIDDCKGTPDVLLIATGSEVGICSQAKELLEKDNIKARVISLPCIELFEKQSAQYKESVIPKAVKARVCVEAASPLGWREYAGDKGKIIAMNTFGLSAPFDTLYKHFGFTPEIIAYTAKNLV